MPPLPEHRRNQGHDRNRKKENNEAALKPVFRLTAIENYFKERKAKGHENNPEPVNPEFSVLARSLYFASELGRVGDEPASQNQRQNPNRNINEENPTPAPVVGDPSPERRPDHRCRHNGHAIQSKCRGPFLRRKCVHKNRLLDRSQPAASNSLQHTKKDEQSEGRR